MKRLGLVVFPGFQILDLAAASVFEVANLFASRPTYEVALYSEHGGRWPHRPGSKSRREN